MDHAIALRPLQDSDPKLFEAAFAAIGWCKPQEQYLGYLAEQRAGARVCVVAEVDGAFAGYGTLRRSSDYPPFRHGGVPEVADLNVLPPYRRRGVGTALLDALEHEAAAHGPRVGIGVGLSADYGAAQRLYVQRGYVPDGRGVMHHDRPVAPGALVPLDDDATLMLVKDLR